MNIFNWAQDHNIIFIENIDWWLLRKAKHLYNIIHPHNRLTNKRARKICELMFNQICINASGNLVRLIGFVNGSDDYYYITKNVRGEVVWETMVGRMTPLKGKISNWDYWYFENGFTGWIEGCGMCPPEKEFLYIKEPEV